MKQQKEILNALEKILTLDKAVFDDKFRKPALSILKKDNGGRVYVSGLLAFSNICNNNCYYCGLRRNHKIPRYCLDLSIIEDTIFHLKQSGLSRIFFISGESFRKKTDFLLKIIEKAHAAGLETNMASGVFSRSEYKEMKDAGLDMYTLKFESANKEIFSACKPDISFEKRITAIEDVKAAGLQLGSGNLVGLKGQTIKDVADDIRLMKELEINWAPVVPYLPAPETPMGKDTPMGDTDLTLRVLSLIRLLLPECRITAGQPRKGSKLGFADPEGNQQALDHGADSLFIELTPLAQSGNFDIAENRQLPRLQEIRSLLHSRKLIIV